MGVADRLDPSLWGIVAASACGGAATLGHLALGADGGGLATVQAGVAVLLIAVALPPVPWTSVDAIRWTIAGLALLPVGLGPLGAYSALGVAPLVQATALWSGQHDDWRAVGVALSPARSAIGLGAAIAAIGSGTVWAAATTLGVAAGGADLVELLIAAWIAAPGVALAGCGAAGVLSLGLARREGAGRRATPAPR